MPMNPRGAGISAVIVSYNTRQDTLRCLASLHGATCRPLEVVLVDNGSQDDTVNAVRLSHPDLRIIANERNLGFARANNIGIAQARYDYVLIINSDAEACAGAIDALARLLDERGDAAIVAPRTRNSDGSLQLSFGPPLTLWNEYRTRSFRRALAAGRPAAARRLDKLCATEHRPFWVSGSCFLARARILREAGGFDDGFFLYEEDADLCLRLRRAGWEIVYTPEAEIIHHEGRSMAHARLRSRVEYHRSHLRYYRKHNGVLACLLLRTWILAGALHGWMEATLRRRDRSEHAAVMRLAFDRCSA